MPKEWKGRESMEHKITSEMIHFLRAWCRRNARWDREGWGRREKGWRNEVKDLHDHPVGRGAFTACLFAGSVKSPRFKWDAFPQSHSTVWKTAEYLTEYNSRDAKNILNILKITEAVADGSWQLLTVTSTEKKNRKIAIYIKKKKKNLHFI